MEKAKLKKNRFRRVKGYPANTSIDYWLSNNGGAQSFLVTPGELFTFPTSGSDLRWRAELKSLSPFLSPRLETLSISQGRDIDVDPASVDFLERAIDAGLSDSVTITVSNLGDQDLTFSSFGVIGINFAEFVVTNITLGIILPARESRIVGIAFDPSSVGLKTAAFQISSDDPDEPVVEVLLSGTGVAPPTATPTPTWTETGTATETPSSTATATDTIPPQATATETPSSTGAFTQTPTPTSSETATVLPSPTPSNSPTNTRLPTATHTIGGTPSATASATQTQAGALTPTFTVSPTATQASPVDYDVAPAPDGDGKIDAEDLIEWIRREHSEKGTDGFFFGFARFWMTGAGR